MKIKTQKRGAVLLISILVSSVVLIVGMGVYQRTYKELLIGSFWKQVQIAFSSADAGLECAIYWDEKLTDPVTGVPVSTTENASCFGTGFIWFDNGGWTPGAYKVWSEDLIISDIGGCVNIRVVKMPDGETLIQSRGYNTCDATSARRVERGRYYRYKPAP